LNAAGQHVIQLLTIRFFEMHANTSIGPHAQV
jgi:hypothetical protein